MQRQWPRQKMKSKLGYEGICKRNGRIAFCGYIRVLRHYYLRWGLLKNVSNGSVIFFDGACAIIAAPCRAEAGRPAVPGICTIRFRWNGRSQITYPRIHFIRIESLHYIISQVALSNTYLQNFIRITWTNIVTRVFYI